MMNVLLNIFAMFNQSNVRFGRFGHCPIVPEIVRLLTDCTPERLYDNEPDRLYDSGAVLI